jgi:hypothetical protein
MKCCSTYMAIFAEARAQGLQRGRTEGACQQLRKLALHEGKLRFGPPADAQQALLDALTDGMAQAALEGLAERLPAAAGWDGLLAGVAAPQAPPLPEFMKHYDPEPGPDNPGIDEAMEVADRRGDKRIIHLRIQSMYQEDIGRTVHAKNRALQEHYHLPAESFVILLWRGADGPAVTGRHEVPARKDRPAQTFKYGIQRVWQRKPEEALAGGLGTLPMALMSDVAPERLPDIVRRVDARIRAEAPPAEGANLWMAACFWMGLRYPADMVRELLRDVWPRMTTSKFYQGTQAAGFAEGMSEGLVEGPLLATRRLILRRGEPRLQAPAEAATARLDAINHLETLEKLYERLPQAASWEQLLAEM